MLGIRLAEGLPLPKPPGRVRDLAAGGLLDPGGLGAGIARLASSSRDVVGGEPALERGIDRSVT